MKQFHPASCEDVQTGLQMPLLRVLHSCCVALKRKITPPAPGLFALQVLLRWFNSFFFNTVLLNDGKFHDGINSNQKTGIWDLSTPAVFCCCFGTK